MGYSEHEFRKMDEAFCAANEEALAAPAVGGIAWTTCLAPTPTGPCLKGVQFAVRGAPTSKTKCDKHAVADAPARADLVSRLIADVKAGILVLATVHGLPVTDEAAQDRANNIVCGVVNNYDVRDLK